MRTFWHKYPVLLARFVCREIYNIYDRDHSHYHTSKVRYTMCPRGAEDNGFFYSTRNHPSVLDKANILIVVD
jgi:hypothetical protein